MGLRADSVRPQRVSGSARIDSQRAESARIPIAAHVNFGDESVLSAFTRTQWTAALTRLWMKLNFVWFVCFFFRAGFTAMKLRQYGADEFDFYVESTSFNYLSNDCMPKYLPPIKTNRVFKDFQVDTFFYETPCIFDFPRKYIDFRKK